ncbi:hypothetical protein [Devosia enhydra]|uniref:hypothetical protein n=1 Tax=Devosia enhydra TaxID=665118 RepID=UPI0009314F25|nr:hypothetical protein [Devosia enhydra]
MIIQNDLESLHKSACRLYTAVIDMVLSMPHPHRHPKTGVWWYRERVSADIKRPAKGQTVTVVIAGRIAQHKIGAELKVSLGTKEAA